MSYNKDEEFDPPYNFMAHMPSGATHWNGASYYRIGVHNKIFIFVNDRWILSVVDHSEIRSYRKC